MRVGAGWQTGDTGCHSGRVCLCPQRYTGLVGTCHRSGQFEVGADVYHRFLAQWHAYGEKAVADCFVPHREERWLCDIYALARLQLDALGVTAVYVVAEHMCQLAEFLFIPTRREQPDEWCHWYGERIDACFTALVILRILMLEGRSKYEPDRDMMVRILLLHIHGVIGVAGISCCRLYVGNPSGQPIQAAERHSLHQPIPGSALPRNYPASQYAA